MTAKHPPFIVLSLPRSRSAWMAHYLRYGGARVGHDTLVECDSLEGFAAQFQGDAALAGSCETGAMLGWRLLQCKLPGVRMVVVQRDPGDVAASLAAKGLLIDTRELEARAAMLESASKLDGVLNLTYEQLWYPDACAALFEFCLLQSFDYGWWENLQSTNIQVDMGLRIDRLRSRAPILESLKLEAATAMKEAPLCHLH